eukprot:CAMPEP_0172739306 /NCGR_PEP_ID=MMETSP1074-20121228/122272_1 /TAXON_ID=2916 /ORGANISM="Ceratium fusus, Strain PA161109" /LENGTH=48 /DNA_ID= /DNA_START= /DNA_END= /DNA_ORIENTATION=
MPLIPEPLAVVNSTCLELDGSSPLLAVGQAGRELPQLRQLLAEVAAAG